MEALHRQLAQTSVRGIRFQSSFGRLHRLRHVYYLVIHSATCRAQSVEKVKSRDGKQGFIALLTLPPLEIVNMLSETHTCLTTFARP